MNKAVSTIVGAAVAAGSLVSGQTGTLTSEAKNYANYQKTAIAREVSKTGDPANTRSSWGVASGEK